MSTLLWLLIFILVAVVILWLVSWILSSLPVPPVPRNLILALVGILLLVYLLMHFGVLQQLGSTWSNAQGAPAAASTWSTHRG